MTRELELAQMLSDGLDLCVRARRLDTIDRTNVMIETLHGGIDMERAAPRLNAITPHTPYETRSLTIPLWVEDQFQKDLAAWEAGARKLLAESGLAERAAISKAEGRTP